MRILVLLSTSVFFIGVTPLSFANYYEGVEEFEKGNFKASTPLFIEAAQKGDTRAPFYLRFLQSKGFIDLEDFSEEKVQFLKRIPNILPYYPKLGQGEATLEISLNYLRLKGLHPDYPESSRKNNSQKKLFNQLLNYNLVSHSYVILAKILEDDTKKVFLKKGHQEKILEYYQKAAALGDFQALQALKRLMGTSKKLSINSLFLQELNVLEGPDCAGKNPGVAELYLSRMYDGHRNAYGIFPKDGPKKSQWQLMSARRGCMNAQITIGEAVDKTFNAPNINLDAPDFTEQARWYFMAARRGEKQAIYMIAKNFKEGKDGFPENLKKAEKFYRRYLRKTTDATDSHSLKLRSQAACNLGNIYERYYRDLELAVKYYRMASEMGLSLATYNLAVMHWNGYGGLLQDKQKAVELYLQAAEAGFPLAQTDVGEFYFKGEHLPLDYKLAHHYLSKSAKQIDRKAQYYLARLLIEGLHNGEQDTETGLKWMQASAEQGYAPACYYLAHFCLKRKYESLPEDETSIINFAKKAAEDETYAYGKSLLGGFLLSGYGSLEKDESKAFLLIQDSAAAGNIGSKFGLGMIYTRGLCGQTQDHDLARKYFEDIAQECPEALNELGLFQENGLGGYEANPQMAMLFYEKAFSQGCLIAGYNLALLLGDDKAAYFNEDRALSLFETVAETGDYDACYSAGVIYLNRAQAQGKENKEKDAALEKAIEYFEKAKNPDKLEAYHNLAVAYILKRSDILDSSDYKGQELDTRFKVPYLIIENFTYAAEHGQALSQFSLGLFLYNESNENKPQALKWLGKAADQNFHGARFAERYLKGNSEISKEVISALSGGHIEEAKQIKGEESFMLQNQNTLNSNEKRSRKGEEEDSDAHQKRLEKRIEGFLDPRGKKTNKLGDFLKIVNSMNNGEGKIENQAGGSGINIRTRGQDGQNHSLSLHRMHRKGRSSQQQLCPGRVGSLCHFIEDIREKKKGE